MITLADLTLRRHPVAYARARLDTQSVLTRRLWSHRADAAFWSLWLAAIAAFVAMALWADHRYTLPLDRGVTFGVQELYRYGWADRLFQYINDWGSEGTVTFVLFAAIAVALVRGLRFEALMIAGAGSIRYVQLGVRAAVHRPDAQYNALRANFDGLARPRLYPDADGFPSGHVFGATIVYGLIFAYIPRVIAFKPLAMLIRALCVFEIALIGPARMYTGAHWFSDTVGAALLAGIYLALAWKIDGMVTHIRTVAAERGLAAEAGLRAQPATPRRFARTPRSRDVAAAPDPNARGPQPVTRS
jgi:undecaprenyl-diphosphatase